MKHTPPCDCDYGGCDRETMLNGVRFVCTEGQSTYEFHSDDFPVYGAAPDLLKACEAVIAAFDAGRGREWFVDLSVLREAEPLIRDAVKKATE